jgi:hypothetical protein
MGSTENLVVGGFQFGSPDDAATAREEEKKIQYIVGRLNYDEPEGVLAIYNKIINNRLFVTPIGNRFLFEIQEYLKCQDEIKKEDIVPIPLYTLLSPSMKINDPLPSVRIKKKKEKTYLQQYNRARGLIILLIIMIAGMFYISMTANNPNVLNYKWKLENQYASWEEELTQREQIVREKEKELNME